MALQYVPEFALKRYIQEGGSACPACASSDIEGGAIEIDTGYAIQQMCCNECEASWADRYRLSDIEFEQPECEASVKVYTPTATLRFHRGTKLIGRFDLPHAEIKMDELVRRLGPLIRPSEDRWAPVEFEIRNHGHLMMQGTLYPDHL